MPITKLPVVHKFGIISHSQRLELQERLLKQSYLQSIKSRKAVISARNPQEVSEEFIQQFNNAKGLEERDHYEEVAHKMLERSKRRAGVKNCGIGQHVNLPLAWTELAQLAQCKGTIQEECLDVLITSLDVSPLEKYHIPALFFLAETMLYWLRTDALHQPYLRTGEIKLLRMGQLVFTRLFYNHMAGQLQGHTEFKNRLFTYLDGLQECQEAYSPYPNALLSLRFIIEVGKIVLADALIEPGEVKEGDRMPLKHNMEELTNATKELFEKRGKEDSHSAHSGAISSSVHDLSPTLWHALDVWRCTNHLSGGFSDALKALAHCGLGLANESWIDGMCALFILAEAAKANMFAMKVLHHLAQGIRVVEDITSPPLSSRSGSSDIFSISSDDVCPKQSESKTSMISSKQSLSDIFERSEEGDTEKQFSMSAEASSHSSSKVASTENPFGSPIRPVDSEESMEPRPSKPVLKNSTELRLHSREVSFDESTVNKGKTHRGEVQSQEKTQSSQGSDRTKVWTRDSTKSNWSSNDAVPGTGWKVEVGTDLPSGRASDASSVPTFTNLPIPDTPGISGWHWEVAITYTEILADICLHGANANIQKTALIGVNKDLADPYRRGFTTVPLPSAGLIDLAFFHPLSEVRDGGPNDWSWRIRYGAIQSMVKICRCLTNDQNREGLRNAAWNSLVKARSVEKDSRVLEALKVGQVHTNIESLLNMHLRASPSSVGMRIASGLATIYLPPLPPPVEQPVPKKVRPRRRIIMRQDLSPSPSRQPLRTSLKEEIMLATALYEPPIDFNTKTSFDLRRIVEDQWRKELQQKLEDGEEERQKKLAEQQKQEEENQMKKAQNKTRKFKKDSGKETEENVSLSSSGSS